MKRRIGAVGVMAVAALALTACAGGGGGSSSGGDQEITVLWDSAQKEAFAAMASAYEDANPGVTVNVTYAPYDNLKATMLTQLSSNTAADILYVNPGNGNANTVVQLGRAGYLADLSDRDWVSKVPDGIRQAWDVDGKTEMFAFGVSSIGPIWNDQAMEEIGATPPTTWDGFLDLCEQARAAGKVAVAWAGQEIWANQHVYLTVAPTLVYRDDPEWNQQRQDGDTTFADTPGWVETFDKQNEMMDAGCFNDSPSGTSLAQSVDLVATHQALGTIQVAWILNQFTQAAPDDTFTLSTMPATNDTATNVLTTASIAGVGVNAASAHLDLSKDFLDFLTEPAQVNLYAQATGLAIPSIENDEFDYSDPNIQTILTAANADIVVPFADQGWPAPAIKERMDSLVQSVMSTGSPSPEDLLSQVDETWDSSVTQ